MMGWKLIKQETLERNSMELRELKHSLNDLRDEVAGKTTKRMAKDTNRHLKNIYDVGIKQCDNSRHTVELLQYICRRLDIDDEKKPCQKDVIWICADCEKKFPKEKE